MRSFKESDLHLMIKNSPYARRQERNTGGYGGLDKEVFKGDCRDAYLDQG